MTATGLKINGNVQNLAFMANGAYDLDMDWPVTPFVLGGVGVSLVKVSDADVLGVQLFKSDSEAAFAYQVGAGVKYPITDALAMEVSYRFFGTAGGSLTDETDGDVAKSDNLHHNGLVGISYRF